MGLKNLMLTLAALSAMSHSQAAETGSPGVIVWRGQGMQIYSCKESGGRYAWALERPDAELTDAQGLVRGHHGAGPSWTAADGSRIVGRLITSIPAPRGGAIPWLVLRTEAQESPGTLEGITYVLRTDTVGGVAPDSGCDSLHAGAGTEVPYQATYSFLHSASASAVSAAPH